MRFTPKARKTRKHFALWPVKAQSREYVYSRTVWLEWVEVGYSRFLTHKIYYLIDDEQK